MTTSQFKEKILKLVLEFNSSNQSIISDISLNANLIEKTGIEDFNTVFSAQYDFEMRVK